MYCIVLLMYKQQKQNSCKLRTVFTWLYAAATISLVLNFNVATIQGRN